MPVRLDTTAGDFEAVFADFVARRRGAPDRVADEVAAILSDVRERGDPALLDYSRKLDGFTLDTADDLRIGVDEIAAAHADSEPEAIASLELAHARIIDYHRRQLPAPLDYTDSQGVRLGARWTPIAAVGVYIPGGTAAYPSSVLMNAAPARVAGVDRLVMAVPAPGGKLNPIVLAAAHISGVDEIYRIGGAQAIAALAYGTETISPVDKVVGPGNAYVAEAKRQVFGVIGIDMIAGPSEILVVADADNDPDWIAADLLSQAEHDILAQAILMTDDRGFAEAVAASAERHLASLPRGVIARKSWDDHGAIIVVGSLTEAVPLVDRLAPEHLELACADPDDIAAQVRNAGAIFLGRFTPEALGDYVAGPNHVLPTSRSARFSSGLGVLDFLKRTSFVGCDAASLAAIGPAAAILAELEGLDAHALSVKIRLDQS